MNNLFRIDRQHTLRWSIFCLSCSLFILSQFYRAAVAVITPQLMADMAVDTRGLSTVSAAFFYAFALAQIPLAIYLDQLGARKTMAVLNLIAICGALVFATAQTIHMLILSRLLLGIGMAANLMGTFKLISTWFDPRRFATLTALVFSLGTIGSIVAATPLVLMVQWMGWRMTFGVFAGINLVITALFYVIVQDDPCMVDTACEPARSRHLMALLADLYQMLRIRDYWIISFSTFCRYGVYAALQSLYAGPYLMSVQGFSQVAAGNILFLMSIGLIIGGPVFGFLSDRVFTSRKWYVILGLVVMAMIISALAGLRPEVGMFGVAVLFFLLGLINSTGGIMYSHIKEELPLEKAGTAMTGINFFTMIGPAIFLQGLGALMQHVYPDAALKASAYRLAFFVCAFSLFFMAVIYLLTKDTVGGIHRR